MQTEYTDGYFNVSKKYGFLPMYSYLNDDNFPNKFRVLKHFCDYKIYNSCYFNKSIYLSSLCLS